MEKNERYLVTNINNILFNNWDPIGINRYAPNDEYAEYASHIASSLKIDNANDVFVYLRSVRVSRMQIPCDDRKDRKVADMIFEMMNEL